ncbi:MAG: hypothetical protein ACJAZT_002118, partial [Gammaproteobacteria bacterium]
GYPDIALPARDRERYLADQSGSYPGLESHALFFAFDCCHLARIYEIRLFYPHQVTWVKSIFKGHL